ncbi:MAG: ABC transporter permease [Anaerolineae bacterium]|nr:ABC transporter permease [Anaerolineae bacterium]
MQRYIARRLIILIPTLLGVSIVTFALIHLIPGDALDALIGTQYALTEAQAAALRSYFGIDKPLHEQYWVWLTSALQGDMGYSIRTGKPVLPQILAHYPLTLELTLLATVVAICIGLPIGMLSAVRTNSALDLFGRFFALLGLSLPNFWLGTLIILVLSLYFRWLPNTGGYVDFFEDPLTNLKQLIFPALTLGTAMAAAVMRMTRSAMLEVLGQDYVRTARSKGLSEWIVISGHSLRNALIPVITIVAIQMGYLLGGTVIVEEIFSLPGVGRLTLNAIYQRDYAMVQAAILFIAFNFVVINLLADVAYGFTNPTIRYKE